MSMKKSSILLILALSMLLVACGGNKAQDTTTTETAQETTQTDKQETSQEPAGDQVVINFFHRWPNEPRKSYFDERIAAFEAENPNVKINVDSVLNDSFKEKIRVLISSDDLPDIFVSWSDSFAENLVSSGRIKPLNELYESDTEWSGKIIESQIGAFTFDDVTYGVPLTIDGKLFLYNKEIFDELGLKEPQTFEELLALLDELKTNGYDTPLMEGLTNPWTISHYLGTIFQRLLDPTVMAKDFQLTGGEYTDPAYIEGLKAFKELTDRMGDTANAIDHETARNMFGAGEVPVMYLQLAEIKMVEDMNDFEIGMFDFPSFPNGKGDPKALTGAPEGFMLSQKAPKEAEEFLKFLTSEESAFLFTKEAGQLNAIQGAVTEENTSPKTLESYDIILNASNTTPWFDNAVSINIADIFMRGGQTLALGETTPEEIMEEVQAEAQR